MDQNNVIESGGFYFIYNFDSGNLGHVEKVPSELIAPSVVGQKSSPVETPDHEFNLWTRPDCAGTEFENGNRTWFYFGIQASEPNVLVRLNIINLNKQGKMYAQGMAPVTRTLPGKPQWERIRDRPVHYTDDNAFTLSFKYRTSENTKATTFFAFTYPFSFAELQIALNSIDMKMLPLPPPQTPDDIYYYRECLIYSLEGRRVDLLTITSHHGITTEREDRIKNLFPEKRERPFKFHNKKVIFVSARVHPGETPSSFVFNGFLNLLLNRNDPIAIQLRKIYVFKMIPILNPDGVARGHYRTDTRGVNLNRVYLNPSLALHPTIFASRALIRFYHYGYEKEDCYDDAKTYTSRSIQNVSESAEYLDSRKKKGSLSANSSKRPSEKSRAPSNITVNKSSTTIKQPSESNKRDSRDTCRETGALVEQVYDMSLSEMPSKISQSTCNVKADSTVDGTSLLNEQILRTCLGSNVHLSDSAELEVPGGVNPLRPLRDTLKNSISLLMGSTSSVGGDNSTSEKDSRVSNVRMEWCKDCRAAVSKLEESVPGFPGLVPGYSYNYNARVMESRTHGSIQEYREFQQKKIEADDEGEVELKAQDALVKEPTEIEEDIVYFCTNCFKRYMLTKDNKEIACDTVSVASVCPSGGDSGSLRVEPRDPAPAAGAPASTGDTLPSPRPSKEEKSKSKGKKKPVPAKAPNILAPKEADSGLFLYLDLHGHASKKGIFMYGNHFNDVDSCVECMLLPRIMSLNNLHFHFSSCNFTERNMYLKDRRDGMSREGSGRVAVLKATGLVRSYTLECNYNTGRLVNVLPPCVREATISAHSTSAPAPPKYTPHIFEETLDNKTTTNTISTITLNRSPGPIINGKHTFSIIEDKTAYRGTNISNTPRSISSIKRNRNSLSRTQSLAPSLNANDKVIQYRIAESIINHSTQSRTPGPSNIKPTVCKINGSKTNVTATNNKKPAQCKINGSKLHINMPRILGSVTNFNSRQSSKQESINRGSAITMNSTTPRSPKGRDLPINMSRPHSPLLEKTLDESGIRNTSPSLTRRPYSRSQPSKDDIKLTYSTSTERTAYHGTNISNTPRSISPIKRNRNSLNPTQSLTPGPALNANDKAIQYRITEANINSTQSRTPGPSNIKPTVCKINGSKTNVTGTPVTLESTNNKKPAQAKINGTKLHINMPRILGSVTNFNSRQSSQQESIKRESAITVNSTTPRSPRGRDLPINMSRPHSPLLEKVGRSLGASILDLTGQHPNSRIPCSEHRTLTAVREWLRAHTKTIRPQLTLPRLRAKTASPTRAPLYTRPKGKGTDERKENAYRAEPERRRPSPPAPLAPLAAPVDVVNLNLRMRARYLLDGEPKPKSLAAKRRNVLSIRKPNTSKTHVGATRAGAGKARRSAEENVGSRASLGKLGKRPFPRGARKSAASAAPVVHIPRALASSSASDESVDARWEEGGGGGAGGARRRASPPHAAPALLKKIRLKAGL